MVDLREILHGVDVVDVSVASDFSPCIATTLGFN
jgi:hypothetical protein